MENLRTELATMVDEAEWSWLIPHAQRDALVVVNPSMDLVEVGMAIATDNVACVQQWIGQQLIAKPSPTQLSDWNQQQTKRFSALIVQPYVLVQES